MPEEIYRILTNRISNLLFCPTDTTVSNLKKEGFDNFKCKVIKTGDVMQDGSLYYKKFKKRSEAIPDNLEGYILCTIHRAENTESSDRLRNILTALNEISQTVPILLPIHPRTRKILLDQNITFSPEIHVIDPVGYLEMVYLIDNCQAVMTDSGGLQKEAFFFSKPCITLRDETEWVELVENGFNILAGAQTKNVLNAFSNLKKLENKNFELDLYGNGHASRNIIREILS